MWYWSFPKTHFLSVSTLFSECESFVPQFLSNNKLQNLAGNWFKCRKCKLDKRRENCGQSPFIPFASVSMKPFCNDTFQHEVYFLKSDRAFWHLQNLWPRPVWKMISLNFPLFMEMPKLSKDDSTFWFYILILPSLVARICCTTLGSNSLGTALIENVFLVGVEESSKTSLKLIGLLIFCTFLNIVRHAKKAAQWCAGTFLIWKHYFSG